MRSNHYSTALAEHASGESGWQHVLGRHVFREGFWQRVGGCGSPNAAHRPGRLFRLQVLLSPLQTGRARPGEKADLASSVFDFQMLVSFVEFDVAGAVDFQAAELMERHSLGPTTTGGAARLKREADVHGWVVEIGRGGLSRTRPISRLTEQGKGCWIAMNDGDGFATGNL
jgi:hypothetical protein